MGRTPPRGRGPAHALRRPIRLGLGRRGASGAEPRRLTRSAGEAAAARGRDRRRAAFVGPGPLLPVLVVAEEEGSGPHVLLVRTRPIAGARNRRIVPTPLVRGEVVRQKAAPSCRKVLWIVCERLPTTRVVNLRAVENRPVVPSSIENCLGCMDCSIVEELVMLMNRHSHNGSFLLHREASEGPLLIKRAPLEQKNRPNPEGKTLTSATEHQPCRAWWRSC